MEQNTHSIVLLNSDVYSTAIFKYLLEETSDVVYAHHVQIQNSRVVHREELEKTRELVQFFKKDHRNLDYSESLYNFPDLGVFLGYDLHTACFFASHLAMNIPAPNIRVLFGNPNTSNYGTASQVFKNEISSDIHRSLEEFGKANRFLKKDVPIMSLLTEMSEKDRIEFLGKEVVALTRTHT